MENNNNKQSRKLLNNTSQKETPVCYIFDIDIFNCRSHLENRERKGDKQKRRERERNAPIFKMKKKKRKREQDAPILFEKKERENFHKSHIQFLLSICAAKMFRLVKALEMLFDTNASVH